jgi:hypothetical protein
VSQREREELKDSTRLAPGTQASTISNFLDTMSNNPRPIHTIHRDLRETPDEAEPSFSYEQESFLGREEDDVEDEFHRRLASNSRAREGSGGISSGSGAGGSFWRTDATPNWGQQGPNFNSARIIPNKDGTAAKERKASGGLLGAALQLQSQFEPNKEANTAVSTYQGRPETWILLMFGMLVRTLF